MSNTDWMCGWMGRTLASTHGEGGVSFVMSTFYVMPISSAEAQKSEFSRTVCRDKKKNLHPNKYLWYLERQLTPPSEGTGVTSFS